MEGATGHTRTKHFQYMPFVIHRKQQPLGGMQLHLLAGSHPPSELHHMPCTPQACQNPLPLPPFTGPHHLKRCTHRAHRTPG
jgi:hypothetical protein